MGLRESILLRQCKQLLTYLQNQKKLIFKRISTTGIPIMRHGKYFVAKNDMEGMSDLLIFLNHHGAPITLHIECKSEKGKLSVGQVRWRDMLKSVGHDTYFMIRSIDELKAILDKYEVEL